MTFACVSILLVTLKAFHICVGLIYAAVWLPDNIFGLCKTILDFLIIFYQIPRLIYLLIRITEIQFFDLKNYKLWFSSMDKKAIPIFFQIQEKPKLFFFVSDLENQLTEKENSISKMAQEIDHLKKRNEILNHESQNKVKG